MITVMNGMVQRRYRLIVKGLKDGAFDRSLALFVA